MWRTKVKWGLLALALLSLLSGCVAKTTVVDFNVQLEVNYVDAHSQAIDMASVPNTESSRLPARLSLFPLLHYRDNLLSWDIDVRSHNIAFYYLENQSAQPLTIYWDQALVSSSQHPADRHLTSAVRYNASHELPQLIEPGVVTFARLHLNYERLFKSERLFDVQYTEEKTRLDKTGVGEWLLIKLPIDSGEQRLIMQIKLAALDAKARLAYSPYVM